MEENVDYDDADEFFQNFLEQLEGLSLSKDAVAESTDHPWNINALLEPLPPQFQKQAPPPSFDVAEGLEDLDQLMGPDIVYAQDQSVQFGSNKSIIAVDPTRHLFRSNLKQCCIAETSKRINPTLRTGRSPSQDKQGLFPVPPESIQFKPIESSRDTSTADSDQQQPRKRQRR